VKEAIAAFDLDGTLTRGDTFVDLLLQTFGYPGLAWGLVANGPILLKYLLRIASNHEATESLFSHYFKGWNAEEFDGFCRIYALEKLPRLLRKEALSRCDWHASRGDRLVLITASLRNWAAPWATNRGFSHVIATEIDTEGGTVTGRFKGRNCSGPEKVRRLLEIFPDRDQYTLFAYGDSRGDEALLSFADHAFFRRFH
jgi:phosphatidylglycerophosphatase C